MYDTILGVAGRCVAAKAWCEGYFASKDALSSILECSTEVQTPSFSNPGP